MFAPPFVDPMLCRILAPGMRGGFAFLRDLSVLMEGDVARRAAREWMDTGRYGYTN